ncbi:MAG: hypothetical protein GF311_27845, partial [Candidatus Lokiarchaeota archaeon]|nr:hypothetical protein [Candidatus Lokiarchaeota archaeon]
MTLPAINELKDVIIKIQNELVKTQDSVQSSLSEAQNRLSSLISSIEAVEMQLGIVDNEKQRKQKEKKTVTQQTNMPLKVNVGSRNWSESIIKLLRNKPMATKDLFQFFIDNGLARSDSGENRKRDHSNMRLALHN